MLVSNDTKPEKSLYVIGAYILKTFSNSSNNKYELENLYNNFLMLYPEDITLSYFVYGLDWLYLCDKISFKDGYIKII